MTDNEDFARARVLVALKRIPKSLRHSVLSDGQIVEKFELGGPGRVSLFDGISISRGDLIDGLRSIGTHPVTVAFASAAADGSTVEATVSSDVDNAAIIRVGEKSARFLFGVLLSGHKDQRIKAFEYFVERHTIKSSVEQDFRSRLEQGPLTFDEFVELCEWFNNSLESFAQGFVEIVTTANWNLSALLPADDRYWDNLVPAFNTSLTFKNFVELELTGDGDRRCRRNPSLYFRAFSLMLVTSELSMHKAILDLPSEEFERLLALAEEVDDPMSLIGTFEMCAMRLGAGLHHISSGERILKKLFSNLDRLREGLSKSVSDSAVRPLVS
jgi:hypothetical protein